MLSDSEELRGFLKAVYPSFKIDHVAKTSGQRVVYFGKFISRTKQEPLKCDSWGDVVLKLSEAESRASITYVQQEVAILSQLDSPHYPTIHFSDLISEDPITESPLPKIRFISIEEKLSGTTLANVMKRFKTEEDVKAFIFKMLTILKTLWNHPKKLVHRDLKPDNIIIDEDGKIHIIDLGILRETGAAGITNSLHPFGPCTPFYSSPEQALNDKANITFKTDMFAIGIIAYEMLSGKNPFADSSSTNYVDEVLERVCTLELPSLCSFGISEDMDIFLQKLLAKEPYKRFRTPELAIKKLQGK